MAASERSELLRLVDRFLLDCRARRLSPRTLDFYQWQLERLVGWLASEGVAEIGEVTRSHLRAYLVSLEAAGWRDRSAHAAGRAARVWFGFLAAEEVLARSPMDGVKLPKVAGDVLPALEVEEIERLLIAATSTRDRAMILALLDTGCRAAEFVALNVGDVAQDGTVLVRQGKGKKARRVRLGERSLAAVRAHLAEREQDALRDDAPLWLSENSGARLGVQGLRQTLYRLGKIVGLERPHPHAFRRSCALFMWRAGATEWAIASYLGHSDLTTIRRYLAIDDTDMVRVHEHYGAVRSLEEARPAPRERPQLRIVGGRR